MGQPIATIGTGRNKGCRPLVQVGSIYGKAVAWSNSYGLIEWLDASGTYHLGWAQSASIKRVTAEEWKGSSGLYFPCRGRSPSGSSVCCA